MVATLLPYAVTFFALFGAVIFGGILGYFAGRGARADALKNVEEIERLRLGTIETQRETIALHVDTIKKLRSGSEDLEQQHSEVVSLLLRQRDRFAQEAGYTITRS